MIRAIVLLAIVLATHYGYGFLADPIARRWFFYVARGFEAALLAALAVRPRPWPSPAARALGGFAAMLAFIEEAQTSICGAAEWRVDIADDLCMSWLGGHVFAAIAAGAIASLAVTRRE